MVHELAIAKTKYWAHEHISFSSKNLRKNVFCSFFGRYCQGKEVLLYFSIDNKFYHE